MSRDDIIRMAREAQQERLSLDGRSPSTALSGYWFSMEVADLARFAALVRADERERIKAEPVAGVVLNEEGRAALVEHGREEWHCAARNARRLYTAPPKLVPLTEEEIEDIYLAWDVTPGRRIVCLVRAVERALEKKNRGR